MPHSKFFCMLIGEISAGTPLENVEGIKVFVNSDFSKVGKRNICEVTGSSGPCRLVTFGCGFTGAVGPAAFLPVFGVDVCLFCCLGF